MQFQPLSPEFSYVSGNSWSSDMKHTHKGTESRREEICGIIICKWKASPVEECDG